MLLTFVDVIKPFIKLDADLSEGITYDSRNRSLLWIDIKRGCVYRTFLSGKEEPGEVKCYKADSSVGVIGLTSDVDKVIVGASKSVKILNMKTGETEVVAKYPKDNVASNGWQLRSNDGSVDSNGNFWVASMCDFSCPEVLDLGTLYRLNAITLKMEPVITGTGISNGLNWYDGHMYWTSSKEHIIYKFEADSATQLPDLETKTPFVKIAEVFKGYSDKSFVKGEPDGFCMDSRGHIFTAVWGTNRAIELDTSGKLVREFIFPAKRVSCTTIGGKNMNTLFVTTGLNDEPDADPNDMGGCIFKVDLGSGVKGVEKNKWKGPLTA